jgi:hypothetical protein
MFSISRNMYGSAKDVEQVNYVCIFQQVFYVFYVFVNSAAVAIP